MSRSADAIAPPRSRPMFGHWRLTDSGVCSRTNSVNERSSL
jgi:hypothetical protein